MMKKIFEKSILIAFILIAVITFGVEKSNAEGGAVNLTIRNGSDIIFNESVPLQSEGIIELEGNDLAATSVLSVLHDADIGSVSFAITDLQYYDSFGSFYLNCINSACGNWQYTVDGSYSDVGMDKFILAEGQSVYLYFGPQHKISISSDSITTKDDLVVSGQNYVYESDEWEPLSGITIGVTEPNPSTPWAPTEIDTKSMDSGQVVFSYLLPGSYNVGIQEDYYSPSLSLTVTEAPVRRSSSGSSVMSTCIGESDVEKVFSTQNALQFLFENQNEDGSFGNSLYTDWVAVGVAKAGDESKELKDNLIKYLKSNKLQSEIITDNERHAMALMSLGINPYTGTEIDYIKKITNSFDGTQIGDTSLYNDDIFALIVLYHAGYRDGDDIIKKIISYIISKQSDDGSWGSVDMTSAGIQALYNFRSLNEVEESISKAQLYLKNSQKEDGGFENSFASSWAIQAMSPGDSFQVEVDRATKYVASEQLNDGGLDQDNIESRIWATSYAIPAVLKLSWNDILESFSKEDILVLSVDVNKVTPVNEVVKVAPLKKALKENVETVPELKVKEVVQSNLLTASTVELNQQQESSNLPAKKTIWQRVVNPFKQLFIKLGF